MADRIEGRQRAVAQDGEVQDALGEIVRFRGTKSGLGSKPGFRVSFQKLVEMEAILRDPPDPPGAGG
jgi:hypothetical protein